MDKVNTPKYLESIRKHLPQAEIILFTYEDSNVRD
ncbi:MAG: WavE lipopolysaccharide synthesis family protein [Helicobacteraceae bacterium]|nr:WavE lipopolysaccharide synthesis family protein [Helicobacteraceae bacterium]